MWWKEKTGKSVFRKMRYSIGIFLIVACTFGFNGCATEEKDKGHEKQSEHAEGNIRNQIISDSKKLAEGYRVLYEEAEKEEQLEIGRAHV